MFSVGELKLKEVTLLNIMSHYVTHSRKCRARISKFLSSVGR